MAYIGKIPATQGKDAGPALKLDDISGDFDGLTKTFSLSVDGTSVDPHVNNISVYLSGVYQIPGNSYSLSGSYIVFTGAPSASLDFHGSIVGDSRLMTPDNDTIETAAFTAGTRSAISGSFRTELSGSHVKLVGGGVSGSSTSLGSFGNVVSATHITASGNISASGTVFADTFQSTGGSVDGISFTDDLNLSGNFTASGDISGSGNIFGTGNLDIDGTSNLQGNVTLQNDLTVVDINASGNITGSVVSASSAKFTSVDIDGGTIIADSFTGTFDGALSSSAQIAADISGSRDAASISGSLGANASTIRTLSSATVSGSRDAASISGSLGANAGVIRTLSAATVSGSFGNQRVGTTDDVKFANITGSGNVSASGNLSITGNADIDGTSNFAGNVTMQNDLTVTGRIDAEEIHTTFISSSIAQATGSNIFGDRQDDIHQFTGSIQQSGSTGHHYFQTGNVGIGTTAPSRTLHVSGGFMQSVDSGNGSGAWAASFYNYATDGHGVELGIGNGTSTNSAFEIQNSAENRTFFKVAQNGTSSFSDAKLGIGLTNPSNLLHVEKSVADAFLTYINNTNSAGWGLKVKGGGNATNDYALVVETQGSSEHKMRIDGTGDVIFGGANQHISGSNTSTGSFGALGIRAGSNPTYPVTINDSKGGLALAAQSGGSDRVGLYTGNDTGELYLWNDSDVLKVLLRSGNTSYINGGNVGIGTSTVPKKLTVAGEISGSDDLTISGDYINIKNTAQSGLRVYTNDTYANLVYDYAGNLRGRMMYEGTQANQAQKWTIYANNSEKMVISGSGEVGIGTNAPANNLHIHTDSGDEGILIKSTGDTSNAIISSANRSSAGAAINNLQGQWNGTAVADMIFFTGTDTSNKDDGVIVFRTSAADDITERMRIDKDGMVGIGTNSPTNLLTIHAGTSTDGDVTVLRLNNDETALADGDGVSMMFGLGTDFRDAGKIGVFSSDSSHDQFNMRFTVRDASNTMVERMRIIGSSGNVGIGTDAPNKQLEVAHATDPVIRLNRKDSTIVDTENLGSIQFSGDDPATDTTGAIIQGRAEGAWATNDYPSALLFYTCPDGDGDVYERMRINNGGKVGIGTSSPNYALTITASYGGENNNFIQMLPTGAGTGASDGMIVGMAAAGPSYVWNYENTDMHFGTNGTTRMTIDNEYPNVGIGTNNPSYNLDIQSGSADTLNALSIYNTTNGGDTKIRVKAEANQGGDPYIVFDAGGVDMYVGTFWQSSDNIFCIGKNKPSSFGSDDGIMIDKDGMVGIGTTNPSITSGVGLHVETARSGKHCGIRLHAAGAAAGADWTMFATDNDQRLLWYDNNNSRYGLCISGSSTHASIGIGMTEPKDALLHVSNSYSTHAVKIDNHGSKSALLINSGVDSGQDNPLVDIYANHSGFDQEVLRVQSVGSNYALFVKNAATNGYFYRTSSGTGMNASMHWASDVGGTNTIVCTIRNDGDLENTNDSYGGLSDRNIKSYISDSRGYLADINKLKVKKFKFNSHIVQESEGTGSAEWRLGLIAQDVEEIFPGLVTSGSYEGAQTMYSGSAENDTITKVTGSEAVVKSLKYSIFNKMLIKSVQELTDEIRFLRASITGSTDINQLKALVSGSTFV